MSALSFAVLLYGLTVTIAGGLIFAILRRYWRISRQAKAVMGKLTKFSRGRPPTDRQERHSRKDRLWFLRRAVDHTYAEINRYQHWLFKATLVLSVLAFLFSPVANGLLMAYLPQGHFIGVGGLALLLLAEVATLFFVYFQTDALKESLAGKLKDAGTRLKQ